MLRVHLKYVRRGSNDQTVKKIMTITLKDVDVAWGKATHTPAPTYHFARILEHMKDVEYGDLKAAVKTAIMGVRYDIIRLRTVSYTPEQIAKDLDSLMGRLEMQVLGEKP